MSSIDLLIGIGPDKLNAAIAQLFQNQALRDKVFSGTQNGTFSGVDYAATYKLAAPPAIDLRPPTPDEWKKSVKAGGVPGIPVDNAFIVRLSSFEAGFTSQEKTHQFSFNVSVIGVIGRNGNKATLAAYSLILDLTAMSPMDKFVVTTFLIPQVLKAVNQALEGFSLPVPSLAGINLTQPAAGILNDTLVIAYNLTQNGPPDLRGHQLPANRFFVLASQPLVQQAVNYIVSQNIVGKTFDQGGSKGGGGFSASYDANGRVNSLQVQTTNDPTVLSAQIDLGLSASAGISTPLGYIVQAGEVVYGGLKTAGEGIKSVGETVGNALNPTHW